MDGWNSLHEPPRHFSFSSNRCVFGGVRQLLVVMALLSSRGRGGEGACGLLFIGVSMVTAD